jgi:nucleotide-binding universal stress UspA family protein
MSLSSRKRARFRIIVATDGSPTARAAVETALEFPWPDHAEATAIVARGTSNPRWSPSVSFGIDAAFREIAAETERALHGRWPNAAATVVDAAPVDAILKHARGARVVVLGSQGHSRLQRWMLGSVSRAVVRRVSTSVLIVKHRPPAFREILIGFDGSNHARRAVELVASLTVPPRGRVTLLSFVDAVEPQAPALLPSRVRSMLASEAKAFMRDRVQKAHRKLEQAARPLTSAGWRVRLDVRPGVASRDLVSVPSSLGANLLVVGAQGAGWKRLLLGSVSEAVLDRAPMTTLIVR